MNTKTPRTDAMANDDFLIPPGTEDRYVPADFGRQLETKLNEFQDKLTETVKLGIKACVTIQDWSSAYHNLKKKHETLLAEKDTLYFDTLADYKMVAAERDQLLADKARLDWLCRYWDSQKCSEQLLAVLLTNVDGSLRSAIDAAMKGDKP